MSNAELPPHPHGRAGTWVLDGLQGSVSASRDIARGFLESGRPRLTPAAFEDVLIAVSELVSNAVRHAPGSCVLYLADQGETLMVAVSDTNRAVPSGRRPDLEHGRGGFGWQLLRALSRDLTVTPHRWGKTVRAVLSAPRAVPLR